MNTANTIIIATMDILTIQLTPHPYILMSHTLLLSTTSMVSFRNVEA